MYSDTYDSEMFGYIQKINFINMYVEHVFMSTSEIETGHGDECADVYIRVDEMYQSEM
jgi:hypothetical protein